MGQRVHQRSAGPGFACGPAPLVSKRECARAGARQRKTPSEHFLAGPRRIHHAHHQRHRHGLWDILGKATGQPVGRLLGGRYRERVRLRIASDARARAHGGRITARQGTGISRLQDRLGALRQNSFALDEASCAPRAMLSEPDSQLMVDAGASDAFWPHGYKWALRTAEMLAEL